MIRFKIIAIIALTFVSFSDDSFKYDQLRYSRVREAYKDKESNVIDILTSSSIDKNNLRIYLRAFKQEKVIELWAKNSFDSKYRLIKEYDICRTSGELGPKRKQGDRQIPEGFYHINRFNPYSNFYLSLGINYPNKSDKILGEKGNLGNDIFIHGACVTIGCLPITNDQIKELYIFCIEAKNSGQEKIPVSIFPAELTDVKYEKLQKKYKTDSDKLVLWTDLKKGYDIFNKTGKLPNIGFLSSGRHNVHE
jgi:murein L,D-transpeptidase YafK